MTATGCRTKAALCEGSVENVELCLLCEAATTQKNSNTQPKHILVKKKNRNVQILVCDLCNVQKLP